MMNKIHGKHFKLKVRGERFLLRAASNSTKSVSQRRSELQFLFFATQTREYPIYLVQLRYMNVNCSPVLLHQHEQEKIFLKNLSKFEERSNNYFSDKKSFCIRNQRVSFSTWYGFCEE